LYICQSKGISYGKYINYEKGKLRLKSILVMVAAVPVIGMGGMQITGLIYYGKIRGSHLNLGLFSQ